MIKKIAIFSAIFSITSFNANAKTEGVAVSISALATIKEVPITDTGKNDAVVGHNSHWTISPGFSISKAYNFNNFFIQPEIFFDDNNLTSKSFTEQPASSVYGAGYTGSYNNRHIMSLKYSYGGKINIGKDLSDKVAVFGILGYTENRYHQYLIKDYTGVRDSGGGQPFTELEYRGTESLTDETLILGIGGKYSVNERFDLSASFEI